MNLKETVKALEAKGVTIALNMGAHEHCAVDSNCPLAVELRRHMLDAGVTLAELLEGYTAVTATDPVDYSFPEISGKIIISIAGKEIEFELDDIVSNATHTALDERFRAVDTRLRSIKQLGNSLYSTYLQAIRRAGDSQTLPQLSFPRRELMVTGCLISGAGNVYTFLFPREYKPQYLVSDGIRYKMDDGDIEGIKRDVFLEFKVREGRFLSASLYEGTGEKLEHYHGNSRSDCWGNVPIPHGWNGSLSSLKQLADLIMNSLVTINLDSLMERHPPGMPDSDVLRERSTELGREGEIEVREATVDAPRTGWGARRRAEDTPAHIEEREYMRRWGVTTDRRAAALRGDETNCVLCGRGYTLHRGWRCPR